MDCDQLTRARMIRKVFLYEMSNKKDASPVDEVELLKELCHLRLTPLRNRLERHLENVPPETATLAADDRMVARNPAQPGTLDLPVELVLERL